MKLRKLLLKNLTRWTVGAFVVYETNMKFKRDKI